MFCFFTVLAFVLEPSQKEYDNAETSNANRNKRRERGKEICMEEERESETKR